MSPSDYSRLDGLALASLLRKGETSAFELMTMAVQLARERLKITKEIPLSQLVDWSLIREIKAEK